MCSRCVVLWFTETLLISAHGMRRSRQQLGMVVLRSESWSEDARDTWETAGVREQIAEHFFLGPVVARVIPGTPSQAAAKSAQATVSEFSGGGWELQQAVTPVEGRPPRLFRERRVFTEHQTGRLWPRSCLRDQFSR
jgi:hypothetical protein